jgi:hypothetical protein
MQPSVVSANASPTLDQALLGIEKTAMIRLRAGISFALDEAVDFEQPCEFAFTRVEVGRTRG